MQKQSLLKNLIIIAFSACVAGIASFLFLKNLWPSNLLTASTINLSVPQTPSNAEKYINSTYPNSEKTRRALEQFAEAMETSLLDADNKEVSIVHRFERLRAFQCLLAFYPYLEARQMILNLKEMIVNTAEKAAAWSKLDAHQPLKIFSSPYAAGTTPEAERKISCDFDPDTLAN